MAKEKIVVIDDSPIVRKLAELALEEEGYKVYTAEDGEEGLRISEEVRPSVILVDFIMPRISGYQFCKSARENELLKDIPIILITGKGEDVGKKFAEKFGVIDYFIKPFKSEMLVEKVNSIINAEREKAGEEAPIFGTAEETAAEVPSYSFEESEAVVAAAVPEIPEISSIPELPELPEIPEIPEFPAMPEIPELPELPVFPEVHEIPAMTAEVVPELPAEQGSAAAEVIDSAPVMSFDEAATQEEPQFAFTSDAQEQDLGISSFDFNLEGLATQGIETGEEERISVEEVQEAAAETHEVFDFDTMQELRELSPVAEAAPVSASAPGIGISDLEGTIERIMRRYISREIPMLIENSLSNILKQHGVVKPSTIICKGSLSEMRSVDVLKLADANSLTGKFFAFSPSASAEVYFDKGAVVYALTSKQGKTSTTKEAIAEGISEGMLEAVSLIVSLREGEFFFEKMNVPSALSGIQRRTHIIALLLEGMRRRGDAGEVGEDLIFSKQIGDIQDCGLDDDEQKVFYLADGLRNVSDIAALLGSAIDETNKILYRLTEVGVLRSRGGF